MPLANKEVVHLKNGWEKIQVKKKFIVNIVVVVVGERRAFSLSFSFLLLKELFFVFLIARSRWFENCSNEISLLLSLSLSLSLTRRFFFHRLGSRSWKTCSITRTRTARTARSREGSMLTSSWDITRAFVCFSFHFFYFLYGCDGQNLGGRWKDSSRLLSILHLPLRSSSSSSSSFSSSSLSSLWYVCRAKVTDCIANSLFLSPRAFARACVRVLLSLSSGKKQQNVLRHVHAKTAARLLGSAV